MRLSDFPRPPEDTRIGIHWSAGVADAVGIHQIRTRWIPLLKEMGVKWVKLLHVGGLTLAEELLLNGIMPIVRLHRPYPNSVDPDEGTLGPEEIAALEAFISIGVPYFEFNNEPDSAFEWRGTMPDEATAQRVVARNAIRDMEVILNKGGLPGIPAVSPGKKWDLLGAIIEEGGRDLLGEGVWWAIHNYEANHPVDYPYDDVNQRGRLLTREEYEALGPDAWTGPRWGHRPLEFINRHRTVGVNPGATAFDDPLCWRGYEYFAQLALQHLGFHIPILSTENGPLVGRDDDPRYPTITPQIHRDRVVEECRTMMGTSERFGQAPDYYFCTAYWLLGNEVLGADGPWEEHAWFSPHWPEGHLPVVDALRSLPKRVWRPQHDAVEPPVKVRVWGQVRGGAGRHVRLENEEWQQEVTVGEDELYEFTDVPQGVYHLYVVDTDEEVTDLVVDGDEDIRVDFDLTEPAEPSPPEWTYTVEEVGPSPGFGVVRCQVRGKKGIPVHLWADGWEGVTRTTGSKPELGEDVCEFAPLSAGTYYLEAEGVDVRARVTVDPRRILLVHFYPRTEEPPAPAPAPQESVIEGEVLHPVGWVLYLRGPVERSYTLTEEGTFRFEGLPAGEYVVEIDKTGIRATVTLDGHNHVHVRLEAPVPRESRIYGRVLRGASRRLRLLGPDVNLLRRVAADGTFEFTQLPPGTYTLQVVGTDVAQEGIELDGRNQVEVSLELPLPADGEPVWTYTVEDGGPSPGFGVVRCQVEGMEDLPVRLWADGWPGTVKRTGSKPEYGADVCEFAPLGSGRYYLEPEGLGVRATVRVDGHRVLWVRFRQQVVPHAADQVREAKVYDVYLWPARRPPTRGDFEAVLRYVTRVRPEIGQNLEEAKRARLVIVLGERLSPRQEEALKAAGTRILRLPDHWERLLEEDG